jgi:hypothetical protein
VCIPHIVYSPHIYTILTEKGGPVGNASEIVFETYPVPVLGGTSTILAEVFSGFLQYLQANAGTVP